MPAHRHTATASERTDSGIAFRDAPPDPRLAPWVASFWLLRIAESAAARRYWVLPDGCAHLVLPLHGGHVTASGPRPLPQRRIAVPGSNVFGVRVQPGALRAMLRLEALPSLRARSVALHRYTRLSGIEGWARTCSPRDGFARLVERATAALLPIVADAREPDAIVTAAIRRVHADHPPHPTVASLAAGAGLSPRQFLRRFVDAVDLTPREYGNIWRFRRCVLGLLEDHDSTWTTRAATGGFADQSHLIREFRRLGGMTPRQFVTRLRNVAHERVWDPTRPEYRPS